MGNSKKKKEQQELVQLKIHQQKLFNFKNKEKIFLKCKDKPQVPQQNSNIHVTGTPDGEEQQQKKTPIAIFKNLNIFLSLKKCKLMIQEALKTLRIKNQENYIYTHQTQTIKTKG